MTFCLGIKLSDGLVGIADTRVLSGNEMVVARKVSVYQEERQALFLMTAGLRSLRDKAVTYFEESLAQHEEPLDHLFKAVNLFAAQVRRVAQEDRGSLQESGLTFDFSALKLVGIVWGELGRKALINAPDGKSYFATVDTYMGKYCGKVIAVQNDQLVIEELYVDAEGKEVPKTLNIPLRRKDKKEG